jgi:hypothetical protein
VDPIAEAHEPAFLYQTTQGAQHLILATEIAELARQEYVVAPARDAFPDPLA